VDQNFKRRRARIRVLSVMLAALFGFAATRLAIIVLFDGPRLVWLGLHEHSAEMKLAAVRGPIVDRNGKPLALSAETQSIYAQPRTLLITTSTLERTRLAALLGLTGDELEQRLHNRSGFVWLARHLDPARARLIEQLALRGVGSISEYKRFYPESNLAGAVVGLAGMDGQGLSGVELQYDRLIRGEPVGLHFYQDALGRPIFDSPLQLKDPEVGARLELTIDSSIQAAAEIYLAHQVADSQARRGTVVIIDPFSGELLALAEARTRGPGIADRLHNGAVQDSFEPGSTVKGLLAAIALSDHVIDESQEIYCEQGEWHLAGTIIHDDGRYGWLPLSGVIEVSSNIGAAKLALALGRRRFYEGFTNFGLGRKTGIDLPGEASGTLREVATWQKVELANNGFGQGLAVTPMQLAVAYAAIANGGLLLRPYVVKAAYDANGRQLFARHPQVIRRVVSPAIAHTVNAMLRGVVNGAEGTAHLARVGDFTVAGKTGTAQVIDPATGTYDRDRLVASFIGFVPAEDPRLVILVVLYGVPRGHFGGLVAAPVFREIASDALERMAVAPPTPIENATLIPIPRAIDFLSPGQPKTSVSQAAISHSVAPAQGSGPRASENDREQMIPDFHGLSLRQAVSLARAHRLALHTEGSGYVVCQQPAAAWPMAEGRLTFANQTETVNLVLESPAQLLDRTEVASERLGRDSAPRREPFHSVSVARKNGLTSTTRKVTDYCAHYRSVAARDSADR
jgi:cell division protein FtsI (penicillin-binding protein 3)